MDEKYWGIDVDRYSEENIGLLMEIEKDITKALGRSGEIATVTLVTKIMLGVFGNVPAFDIYFCETFKINKNSFNEKALKRLIDYYQENKNIIDDYKIKTLDFYTSNETTRYYPKAKIIDMIGFIEGIKLLKKKPKRL